MALSGVTGTIGLVDLSTGKILIESVPDEVYTQYLGGYGLGAYQIFRHQRPGVDPLGSEAWFGLVTGMLTGTDAITGNRFVAVGKSPKTGGFGDANCGGSFGPALKRAGLDAVFFTGISPEPVYAVVENGQIELLPAGELWGATSSATEDHLAGLHGDKTRAAVIGPAGERVSALACIINDHGRAAGRSGLGMVMGAKRLKAVAAVPGESVTVADPEGLKALRRELLKSHYTTGNPLYDFFHGTGTPGALEPNVVKGDCPVRNWAGAPGEFPEAGRISGGEVLNLVERRYGCWKCPIACGSLVSVTSGKYQGRGHQPEYETLGAFGSMCLNDDLASICHCNNLCNEYGLDTISTGATVAFAMECFEHGLVTEEQAGIRLDWGDSGAVAAMTEQLAKGHGPLYDLFGHGVRAALSKLGADAGRFAMEAGGEELPMHDPRFFPGLGVSYAADATPGRHTVNGSWNLEGGSMSGKFPGVEIKDKYTYSGKGEAHKTIGSYMQAVNAAGLCMFGAFIGPASMLPDYLSLASGRDFSMEEVLAIGERIANLRMAFSVREGVVPARDFKLPGRVLGDPPMTEGPLAGVTVDNGTQVREYFQAMGWEQDTGRPQSEALLRLGLDFAADAGS